MTNVNTWIRGVLVAGFIGIAASAPAQQAGLVNVNVGNVILADILDVELDQVPISVIVQAPIGIAANVCNVGANVLAADINQNGFAECDAKQTSEAFSNLVIRQMD